MDHTYLQDKRILLVDDEQELLDLVASVLQSGGYRQIAPAKKAGLAAAIYTQLTDVEDELNGFVTYDRAVVKLPPEEVRKIISV